MGGGRGPPAATPLGVVVDEILDAGLYELDLGENIVGGGRPYEGLGVGVPVVDIGANLLHQVPRRTWFGIITICPLTVAAWADGLQVPASARPAIACSQRIQ